MRARVNRGRRSNAVMCGRRPGSDDSGTAGAKLAARGVRKPDGYSVMGGSAALVRKSAIFECP